MSQISAYHAKYYAHELTRQQGADGVNRLSQSLFDASVDLNPHQIEAALFALRNPLQEGVLLADEVGLGKTIEAGLVLCQLWAERKRQLLIICPASLRKQWAQELEDKFAVPAIVVDASVLRQQNVGSAFSAMQHLAKQGVLIMSYHFATRMEAELRAIAWHTAVLDEAHKLRNAHRESNRMGQALRRALAGRKKLLLTATPLQNSLMELYGLSTLLDEHLFGDEKTFRKDYINQGADREGLKVRLANYVHRTLRKNVLEYIKYTQRKTLTQPFEPTDAEHALYERISAFLQREESYALPKRQRHLTSLILRKLLASSPYAVQGTLARIKQRLEALQASAATQTEVQTENWVENLVAEDLDSDYSDDFEDFNESAENLENDDNALNKKRLTEEILELEEFIQAADDLTVDTKANALLKALELGFKNMEELGAARKAIIFTESKRTQAYLYEFLTAKGYEGKLVSFSGSNNSEQATAIYQNWLKEHQGTDRITGAPQVDRRTALIDYFRKVDSPNGDKQGAEIMLATEAAAEGVNLQFCSLLINYDLPWNPQRVEQRIGRVHRYGQRFDVVVINFLNTRNQADQRVLELLTEKFNLFEGVFGASDEVLGRIEGGLDFEKRVLQIYDTCRTPEAIEAAFDELQEELEESISDKIRDTQAQLLENFDEDVHDRLKLRLDEAEERLDKLGRWFWGVTQFALEKRAKFASASYAFSLASPPENLAQGRYQLIRGAAQPDMLAYAYRLSHPLGQWSLQQGLEAATPTAKLVFNYSEHPAKISFFENLKGSSGWLNLVRLDITTIETHEYLLFSGLTDAGQVLDQEACEKLFNVAAKQILNITTNDRDKQLIKQLQANSQRSIEANIAQALEANQRLFHEERNKLEEWAEDKLQAAEQALKDIKAQIAQLKRDARNALSLQEQSEIQQKTSEAERKQRRLRQEIFIVEDEIIEQRDELIDSLQQRLQETTQHRELFTLRWKLI